MDKSWTSSELKNLLEQVLADKSIATKKFSARIVVKNFNWDTIKIHGRSSEECHKAFDTMTNYVYRTITVQNVCDMAKARLEEKTVPMAMIPDAPRKPLTPFFIFSQKKIKVVMKNDPKLTLIEAQKILTERWSVLSDAKKAKYMDVYKKEKAAYDKAAGALSKSMKNVEVDGRLTPYDLYSWSDEASSVSSKSDYHALGDKQKLKWIWKTIKECKKRKRAFDENPNAGTPPTVHLNVTENKILLTSEGLHHKPERTLLAYYCHQKGEYGKISPSTSQEYKAMSAAAHKELCQDMSKDLTLYLDRCDSYLKRREGTMSTDECESFQQQRSMYQKLIKKFSTKQTSQSSSSTKVQNHSSKGKVGSRSQLSRVKKDVKEEEASSEDENDESSSHQPSQSAKKNNDMPAKKSAKKEASDSDDESDSSSDESSNHPPKSPKKNSDSPAKKSAKKESSDDESDSSSSSEESSNQPSKSPKKSSDSPAKKSAKKESSGDSSSSSEESSDEPSKSPKKSIDSPAKKSGKRKVSESSDEPPQSAKKKKKANKA